MPTSLESAIRQLVETLAAGILASVRAASLAELQGGERGRRGPGRSRGSARPAPAPTAPRKPAARGKRKAAGADTVLDELVDIVGKHPKGIRSEDLRAQLDAEKVPFRLVAQAAEDAGLIRHEGEKRERTFFPK